MQLQTSRLNTAYTQIEQLPENWLIYDYFYVNSAELTFSSDSDFFCFSDFSVQPGETLDFTAQASPKGGEDLVMVLLKDGAQVSVAHQEGANSPTIDDLSATIFYKGIVEDTANTAATFKYCIRGDGPVLEQRMQWGYKRYVTQTTWVSHGNDEVPVLDSNVTV